MPLSASIAPWLQTPGMLAYRHSYRSFRQGGHKGAEGDASDVGVSVLKVLQQQRAVGEPLEMTFPSWLDDTNEDDVNHPIRMLAQWRLAYHRFRRGNAQGAEGEIASAFLTKEIVQCLPVWQLIDFHRRQLRQKREDKAVTALAPSSIHVHFGAGKLCLGLILKCLAGNRDRKPYVLIQSPRGPWNIINESKNRSTRVNVNEGELIAELFVHSSTDGIRALIDHLEAARAGTGPLGGLLLVPKDGTVEARDYALSRADTLSCSVGPGIHQLATMLSEAYTKVAPTERPMLFACENDHAGVAAMGDELMDQCHVVPCMVDRICSSLDITEDENGQTSIIVKTEGYSGEIVVKGPPSVSNALLKRMLPFENACVRVPTLKAQANYFAERKFLLVNGGHTTLAFLTMIRAAKEGVIFKPPGELNLLTWETMSADERISMWTFSLARLLVLLWEYDSEVLMDAHGITKDVELVDVLIKYAADTLRRFSAVPDTTKRILAGGVDNRFEGRLKNVEEFLDAANPAQLPIAKRLLEIAQVGFCQVASEVHGLVSQAYRFTTAGQSNTRLRLPVPFLADTLIEPSPKHRGSPKVF